MDGDSPPPAKRQKGAACVHCRQMKLRCDSSERFPAPCSRCQKAGRDCSIDPSFKRTARRDRLDELEQEIRALRSALNDPSASTRLKQGDNNLLGAGDVPNDHQDVYTSSLNVDSNAETLILPEVQTLEHLEVSRDVFHELLDEYFQHFHPMFPFLPPKQSVLRECCSCRLLFWAIVAVASRSVSKCRELRKNLIWPIRRLAMESAIREIHSPPLVRAYLLLCVWSMPFGAVVDDPCWTYSGIATHKALHLGLHRPLYLKEFYENQPMDSESVRLLRVTWLACFIVNESISARLGLPATVSPDHTVLEALASDDNTVSTSIRMRLELAYKELTFSNLLGHNSSAPDGLFPNPLPVIQAFDSELDQIEVKYRSCWNISLERSFLATKLRLYSYAIPRTEKGNEEPGQDPVAATALGRTATSRASTSSYLAKSYGTALRLIEISSLANAVNASSSRDLSPVGQARPPTLNLIYFWTSWDVGDFTLATLTLLQITKRWHFNNEEAAATNAISRAWNLLSSCSVAEGDHFNRVCDIIEYVSKLHWPRNLSSKLEPTLSTRSRMGTSIQWDLIRRARRRFGNGTSKYDKQLAEPHTEVSPSNSSLNDLADFSTMPDILPTLFDDVLWPTWDLSLGPNNFSLDIPQ